MRRWISAAVTAVMLANFAAWPSAVLAEAMEHDREAVQLDGQSAPVEPSPVHCRHGCAGHYGHHFQGQVPASFFAPEAPLSASVIAKPEAIPPQHIPALPFRPPLDALIRS